MKKKIIALALSIFCVMGLVACGNKTNDSTKLENQNTGVTHTHTYSAEWSKDEMYHWHAATCEHTDEVSDKAEHTFDEWIMDKAASEEEEGSRHKVCSVCSYEVKETVAKIDQYSSVKIEYNSEIDLIPTPINGKKFESFNELLTYFNEDFPINNQERFYILNPKLLSKEMGNYFLVSFDEIRENVLYNPYVEEFFYIYDENLGTMSDVTKDVPFYSMKFECLFFPYENKLIDIDTIGARYISNTKIQFYIENIFVINVELPNLNQAGYVIDYLKKNLIEVLKKNNIDHKTL